MGRITPRGVIPMVLLLHPGEGIVIDSVLTAEADLSNVFSSARLTFTPIPPRTGRCFRFLDSSADAAQGVRLSSIGFIHPGKLQLVKELREHIAGTREKFRVAQGVPGTVMMVFTLPTFRYVFKVIRDVSTKETFRGRRHVVGQYWGVHRMDRVGRMLDIFTFHNLRFQRADFEERSWRNCCAMPRRAYTATGGRLSSGICMPRGKLPPWTSIWRPFRSGRRKTARRCRLWLRDQGPCQRRYLRRRLHAEELRRQ